MGRRILITGASGLLGLNLAMETARDHSVFAQVNRHLLRSDAFRVIQADLLEAGALERLLEETAPDWVIHCAALAEVDACEAQPALAQRLNAELPGRLARLLAGSGTRLLHVSTDAVFDGQKGDYTESDFPNPLSVYAETKLEGERRVAEANSEAIIARVNLFGWGLGFKLSLSEFFVYNLQSGRQVKGFTDVYFCPLLANDLAHIFLKMLAAGLSGLYHVFSRECLSKYDFGLRIARRFDLNERLITPTSVADSDLKARRSLHLVMNTSRIERALGETLPDVGQGIESFYWLYRQGYVERIKSLVV